MIDDRQRLRTPEGAALSLIPVGILPRAAAFFIDFLIRTPFYLVAWVVVLTKAGAGAGLMLILVFFLEWFYPVLFEVLRHGQTPGKRALGIAVTHTDGTPVTLNGSLIRNLIRQADFFPMLYLTGFVAMLSNQRFQRLGDLAGNTMVVYVSGERPVAQIMKDSSTAPDWSATLDDQQTLLALLERKDTLSSARLQELTRFAWPELSGAESEQRAMNVARYLRGHT
ncbi:MAG TPA: RDD family protein [Pseudomonadales bacterium]